MTHPAPSTHRPDASRHRRESSASPGPVARRLCLLMLTALTAAADPAATSINRLGIDLLHRATDPGANAVLSPYSVQSTLSMTHAGASGVTRAEMARTLHHPDEPDAFGTAFAALDRSLDALAGATATRAEAIRKRGGTAEPWILQRANRLYAQSGYPFRDAYLRDVDARFGARPEAMDFRLDPAAAAEAINRQVAGLTRDRITAIIPPDQLTEQTRLVLVNATYLKAPWADPFPAHATRPEPFHVAPDTSVPVPTMVNRGRLGLHRTDTFTAVSIPYVGGGVHLLVIVPARIDGLAEVEASLTAEILAGAGRAAPADVRIHLPRFRVAPPILRLKDALMALGMRTAFNEPRGTADFDAMAPRRPDDYLYLSEVLHRTFLEVDEKGTEAAAATAAVMMAPTSAAERPADPVEVHVDRPFLFAIQHRETGACLFLGRLADPR